MILLTSYSWRYTEWTLTYNQIMALLMTHAIQQGCDCYLINKDTQKVNNQINNIFKTFDNK